MHQVTVVNVFTLYSSQHKIQILKNRNMRARYIIQSTESIFAGPLEYLFLSTLPTEIPWHTD